MCHERVIVWLSLQKLSNKLSGENCMRIWKYLSWDIKIAEQYLKCRQSLTVHVRGCSHKYLGSIPRLGKLKIYAIFQSDALTFMLAVL